MVDNDAYTNAAAKLALDDAVRASVLLEKPYPPEWRKVSDKLWVPLDAANRRYLEHEGYVKTRRKPKQADAQLVMFPLEYPTPDDVARNTMAFYAPNVSPIGPAMTSSVHAVIAARLAATARKRRVGSTKSVSSAGQEGAAGNEDWGRQATDYFRESYRPFLRPPLNDFSEKRPTNNTTFLTGCAGVLLAPLYGFGGIRYDENGITARPYLPSQWKRLTVTGIHYRGKVYDLDVEQGKAGELKERAGPR
jgi:trehalose/maltose hydrolase-like predicted phosphorylase